MSCAIAVMAKAPRAGQVKTRLSPLLTPKEAAQMSAAFLHDITHNIQIAAKSADIAGYVAYAPAGLEQAFDGMLAHGTQLVLADGEGVEADGVAGFGRSLLHATQSLFARGHSAVCVLNADSPTLPTDCLIRAAEALAQPGDHAVLGCAEDGGYYLLGMNQLHPSLYAGMAWSTDHVASQTRAAAHRIDLALHDLPIWYDVDNSAAVYRLLQDLGPSAPGYHAPATASLADALGLRQRLTA